MNAPRHEYSRFDRLTIDGIFYQPDGQNDEFVRLKRLDGSDICSLFTYDDIYKLRGTSGWRLEKDWFAESASPIEAIKPPEFMTASLTPDEQEALTWLRLVFGAMDELRDSGQMALTHERVEECRSQLEALVLKREIERSNLKAKPRGGTKVAVRVFPSTSTLLRKFRTFRKAGRTMQPFVPKRSFCRAPAFRDHESQEFLRQSVLKYATPERPNKTEIFERHRDEVEAQNIIRRMEGRAELRAYSYSTILRHINGLDPFFVNAGRLGKQKARALASSSSGGLSKLYPMQRIELDEWKVDVRTFLTRLGIIDFLPKEIVDDLPLIRRWVCVATDVATRAILGIRIAAHPSARDAVRTLAMAVSNKNDLARSVGAQANWDHYGGLCTVSCDTGPAFLSAEFQAAVTDLGGHMHFGPVGIPELRGTVERTFGTFASKFSSLLPGRTFSNAKERGDYDSDARAVLDDEDLISIIIRWIVDYYHHAPHGGLGGQTPADCWKELTRERFVPSPPDRLSRRVATGIEVERKLTKHGLRLFSNFYTSTELREHFAHSSKRKFRVRIDPEDIGGVAYFQNGKWHDAPARDADFDGISLEAWRTEFNKISKANREAAELAQEQRAEALRSIRARVQDRVEQLLPQEEAIDAESLEKLEKTLFLNKTWGPMEPGISDEPHGRYGATIAFKDINSSAGSDVNTNQDPDDSGWEVEDD